jgi:hypothetical protein
MTERAACAKRAPRLLVLLAIASLTFVGQAARAQQPAPPQGWTSRPAGKAIVLSGPGRDWPALTLFPPRQSQGTDLKAWFGDLAMKLAQGSGKVISASDVTEQNAILTRIIQVDNPQDGKARMVYYGYPTAGGVSLAVLISLVTLSDQDPRLVAADQYVHQLANQAFEVAVAPASAPATSNPAAPPRNSQGQYVGAFGKSDIDLTYHAKGIPPKDRDVPFKGVYLFAGLANGVVLGAPGSYSHNVQQLLLLWSNGVAAKVDANSGNISGHHQSEGFVSIDAADPAAVSGAPFGHYTEDSSAIHVQWNGDGVTDLIKNGANLDGSGQHWTPYVIADGQVLEGTFVRKLEAGLKPQWMVLKKDGTFSGDGLSVPIGGPALNPYFPQQGSGRYEIRKGSMIFYFANGYTQAIACVLSPLNTNDVNVVLLNNFPFERTR